jgi:hypothetical protein
MPRRPIAAVERSAMRVLGLVTFAVHLVGFAADGRIWVQQRAFDKATDPGLWDTLMGGQVGAGGRSRPLLRETRRGRARRRNATRPQARRPVDDSPAGRPGYMVEHLDVYRARLPAGVVPRNRDGGSSASVPRRGRARAASCAGRLRSRQSLILAPRGAAVTPGSSIG